MIYESFIDSYRHHSGRTEPHAIGNMSLSSFGGGSAMIGLPGDFTPPSRFVRAAFFQNTAPQKPDAEGFVFTAFHILGSMEIPIGAQFPGTTWFFIIQVSQVVRLAER